MPKISVKAKPDRIARTSPRGELIPSDRFVSVELTHYMQRLAYHHEDVEVEPVAAVAAASRAAPAPTFKE